MSHIHFEMHNKLSKTMGVTIGVYGINNYFTMPERENKQIIPSMIDFMTGKFYIVILFTKRFHGSADFAFQT